MLLLRKQQTTLSLQISRMARLPDVLPVLRPKRARLQDCRMARLPDFTKEAVRLLDGPIASFPDLTQTGARLPDCQIAR